jgi:hypothetical protein
MIMMKRKAGIEIEIQIAVTTIRDRTITMKRKAGSDRLNRESKITVMTGEAVSKHRKHQNSDRVPTKKELGRIAAMENDEQRRRTYRRR